MVVAIIALLIGILLPALGAVRRRAKEAAASAQLENISKACEAYYLTFNAYPGYLPDDHFSGLSDWQHFTGTENLVLSLLGQTVDSGGWPVPGSSLPVRIDFDEVGSGPKTAARTYGAFYSPKTGELAEIQGTDGSQNEMPELIDPQGGMPIGYFRAKASGTRPADSTGNGNGVYYRFSIVDYFWAQQLKSTDGDVIDERAKSLLGGTAAGGNPNHNTNLAWLVVHPTLSDLSDGPNGANDVARGGYMLMSAGDDMIYMNVDDSPDGPGSQITSKANFDTFMDDNDDVIVHGGG